MKRPVESNGHMDRHPQNDWASVRYDARFDEYWIPAEGAMQLLFFCPWCGEALPPSRRDQWFDALEARGIDPLGDPIPQDFRSGAWRGAASEPATREQGGPIAGRILNLFDEE
ncbi:MAG TPA: hypothetical protein VEW26_08000 [Allosphingosinicella sp.]|nr:hypothetical protein [Allosphingosinicella sp.]